MEMHVRKRVGIMGGTFNPIHNGHLILAKEAQKAANLDKILFIPSGVPWLKADTNVLPGSFRSEMTKLAIDNEENFELSLIEIERAGNSYSYETVLALKEMNPDTDYYFIMGADSLMTIDKWVNPDILMKECTLLVAVRDDCDVNALNIRIDLLSKCFEAKIQVVPMHRYDISSSEIRRLVNENLSISNYVPEKVEKYILEHGLYKE